MSEFQNFIVPMQFFYRFQSGDILWLQSEAIETMKRWRPITMLEFWTWVPDDEMQGMTDDVANDNDATLGDDWTMERCRRCSTRRWDDVNVARRWDDAEPTSRPLSIESNQKACALYFATSLLKQSSTVSLTVDSSWFSYSVNSFFLQDKLTSQTNKNDVDDCFLLVKNIQ